jgi:DNA-binding Lrp family transcriptional regulator
MMVSTAVVLINVEARAARVVYEKLRGTHGVQQVDVVSGPYDLVAVVQSTDFIQLGRLVLDKIRHVEGVTETVTCWVIPVEN